MYYLDNRSNIFLKQIHPVFVHFLLFVTSPGGLQKNKKNVIKHLCACYKWCFT